MCSKRIQRKSASSVTERNDSNGQPIRIDESGRISDTAATRNLDRAAGTDKTAKKGIAAKNKRVAELDRVLKKLYENYALEKIPEERFDALSAEYESEQTQLEKAVLDEQRQLDEIQSGEDKIERFMALVERYRDCTEYSDEVLRQFVEKVIVHETVKDEDGERSREIEVYLNFIGKFDVPVQPVELSPEEQKRQEALKKRRIHERNKRAQARQERMNAQLKNESTI